MVANSHWVLPFNTKLGQMVQDFGYGMAAYSMRLKTYRPLARLPRHSNVVPHRYCIPNVDDATFIAPNAMVKGNVAFGHGTSVLYSTSVKNYNLQAGTYIGDHTTILDRCSIMGTTRIGDNCHVGIGCSLDSCVVKDNVYIGHGVTVSYGCVIEEGAIIAAGSVLPMDTRVGAGELWAGNTAEKVDMVTHHQAEEVQHLVHHAHDHAAAHKESITKLFASNETLNLEWLQGVQAQVEKQQTSVAIKEAADIPLEARRFMQPRVQARRREQSLRSSANTSHIAPWYYRGPQAHKGHV
eukprot:GILI01010568.1.p1 GENE.GILI01010568.1~~GILI01010568.1.p1  ORF type:complete len:296 (-),score=86.49 GILI01010568.1:300-1187(-)